MNASQLKRHRQRIEQFVLGHGAMRASVERFEFLLATPAGPLTVAMHDRDASIFTQFEDAYRGHVATGGESSLPSGKWNFHNFHWHDRDGLAVFEWFERSVNRVLAWRPTARDLLQASRERIAAEVRWRQRCTADRRPCIIARKAEFATRCAVCDKAIRKGQYALHADGQYACKTVECGNWFATMPAPQSTNELQETAP